MINVQMVDALFNVSMAATGQPPGSFMFDRRYLLPFSMLAGAVKNETGYEISEADLHSFLEKGWFQRYERAGWDEDELGVPLYIPSRIGLFLDRRRTDAYTDAELVDFADYEDGIVENVLTVNEFAYEDDDLREVIRRIEEDLLDVQLDLDRNEHHLQEEGVRYFAPPPTPEERRELEAMRRKIERILSYYRSLKWGTLSTEQQTEISRLAYRIRTYNDVIRLMMIKQDRDRVQAGFSVHMNLRGETLGFGSYEPGEIDWPATLYSQWFLEDPQRRVRVPGAAIDGLTVRLTRSPSPSEYERLWKEHDLEEYFRLATRIREERVCPNCMMPLHEADQRRVYCSETCRQSAKQKRYRNRHPRAAARAQWRYWNSISEPKEARDVGQGR